MLRKRRANGGDDKWRGTQESRQETSRVGGGSSSSRAAQRLRKGAGVDGGGGSEAVMVCSFVGRSLQTYVSVSE
jgi:hypothetical protein